MKWALRGALSWLRWNLEPSNYPFWAKPSLFQAQNHIIRSPFVAILLCSQSPFVHNIINFMEIACWKFVTHALHWLLQIELWKESFFFFASYAKRLKLATSKSHLMFSQKNKFFFLLLARHNRIILRNLFLHHNI